MNVFHIALATVFFSIASGMASAAPLPTATELAESQGERKSDCRAALGECLYRAKAVARGGMAVSLPGVLNPRRGTIVCRIKRDDGVSPTSRQTIFAFGGKGGNGSGRLSAYYGVANGAVDRDSANGAGGANINNVLLTSDWEVAVVTWDETHSRYYSSNLMRPYSARPSGYTGSMQDVARPPKKVDFNLATPPDTLFIGYDADGKSALKGEIALFELYEGALDDCEAEAFISSKRKAHLEASRHYFREDEAVDVSLELTPLNGCDVCGAELRLGSERISSVFSRRMPVGDYVISAWKDGRELARDRVSVLRSGNPYVLPHDGHGEFEGLELVESVDVAALAENSVSNRFASVGKWRVGKLNGEKYVEAGPRQYDRFAVRFNVPADAPLCCIEIVYPDDKRRTADIVVQNSAKGGKVNGDCDYTLAVGYAGGGDFKVSGRMRSYRCLYWTRGKDVTAIAMTSLSGGAAAVAKINVYRIAEKAVPAAAVALPPPSPDGDFRHSIAWWEDPVHWQLFRTRWGDAQELSDTLDRLAATMKFAGQDLVVYPGAFYTGLIDETEDPRRWSCAHRPHYFEAMYAKFDSEGLYAVPEINWQRWRFPRSSEVSAAALTDGSLHASAISYATNGLPSGGVSTFNGTPTGHNVQHPQVQAELGRMFDYFIREGAAHPSFKGVAFWVSAMNPCSFGSIERGYNDYNVDSFEKSTGIEVPVDRADPMRAEKYAEWLLKNAYAEWVSWRCDIVTKLYAGLAKKLRDARSDLKLYVLIHNSCDRRFDADFCQDGHERRLELEMGLDTAKLQAAIPNLVVSKTVFPLRHRKRSYWFKSEAARNAYRDRNLLPGFYNALYPAAHPCVTMFNDFIESSISVVEKRTGRLDAPWLQEIGWRVSMWNATGENAMKFYAVPLRFGDVLSFARGGYVVGSYGMEPLTAEFMRNFRALPAVKFDDLPSGEFVKLRRKEYSGRSWFYVVNTGDKPQTVEIKFPNGTVSLADGANCEGCRRMTLAPYSIRSFSAPSGTKPECCGIDN